METYENPIQVPPKRIKENPEQSYAIKIEPDIKSIFKSKMKFKQ